MKLRIKGDYVKGIFEFTPCEITIEFGKVQNVKFNSRQIFNDYTPSYNSEFLIEKIYYDKYYKNLKYTYRISYNNKIDETKVINIKPNQLQVFRIKWAFKKYLIQSEDIKKDVLKYFIGGLIGFIGSLVFQQIKEYNKAPVSPPTTESQKSLEIK
jgi:hypothetical protein